jgi:hypothetical protein
VNKPGLLLETDGHLLPAPLNPSKPTVPLSRKLHDKASLILSRAWGFGRGDD